MNTENKIKYHELSDEEIESVSGGAGGVQYMEIACPECGEVNYVNVMKDSYTCKYCKKVHKISG